MRPSLPASVLLALVAAPASAQYATPAFATLRYGAVDGDPYATPLNQSNTECRPHRVRSIIGGGLLGGLMGLATYQFGFAVWSSGNDDTATPSRSQTKWTLTAMGVAIGLAVATADGWGTCPDRGSARQPAGSLDPTAVRGAFGSLDAEGAESGYWDGAPTMLPGRSGKP